MRKTKDRIIRLIMFAGVSLMLVAASASAATLTVTKIADTDDGVCNADCSLREAIAVAASGDTIVFSALFNTQQTIVLSTPVPNNGIGLTVSTDLTIDGPGADLLTVNGINTRVFDFPSGRVNLSGITIGNGLGILNYGTATTTIYECVITNSYGAVSNQAAMTIENSTITENIGFDEAVYNGSDLALLNSTVSYNPVEGIKNDGALTVTNSTFSGNGAEGIQHDSGTATITGSTIVYNAGGIEANGGSVTVRDTIAAGTTIGNGTDVDENFSGVITSGGYNLIGADPGIFTSIGDQTGTFITPLDPLLDPLDDYGGTTATHRPQVNSPAIDQGYSFGSTEDQRGLLRPFDKMNYPNATGGDGSDIGAYELQFAVVITGAVYNYLGLPVRNARVLIRAANGDRRAVKTDIAGVYRFRSVARNRNYQLSVSHREFEFVPQIVMVREENINNLNFTAVP